MNLRGSTALVTGGGRGLGRALALALGEAGVRVVVVARRRDDVAAVAAQIRAAGGTAFALAADIGDKNAIHPIAAEAAALVGPIDILVNDASTLGPTPLPLLLDTECEDLERVLAVNLVGPFRLTKVIVGGMAMRGHGVVVNVSSDAAVAAYPRWGAYGVSKAALDHLTRVWSAELEGTGVRFLAVDPGEMDTAMHADAIPDADRALLAEPVTVAARIVDMIAREDRAPSGARLEAARWEAPS